MADFIISPNMNLPIPTVGIDPGPDWANNINQSLTQIDSHSHVNGQGVPITPAGMNINADLGLNSNNATLLRSVRFVAQSSNLSGAADLGCLYESGVDLFYNDGVGNQVRITQSGNVAGTVGSIANLTSPASASYVAANETFVWQSNSNTPANLDAGSVIFRNITANSNGITLSAPNSLASNYTLTLPSIPAQTNVVTLANSGQIGSLTYDQVASNITSVGADAIAASMNATGANAIASTMTTSGADAIAGKVDATGANAIAAAMNKTGTNSIVATAQLGSRTTASAVNQSLTADNNFHTILTVTPGINGRYLLMATGYSNAATEGTHTEMDYQLLVNGNLVGNILKTGNASNSPSFPSVNGDFCNFSLLYLSDLGSTDTVTLQYAVHTGTLSSTDNAFLLQTCLVA